MWSDKESNIDFLNFNETAESIKDLITEKNLMPISVGVFGDWGAGKSTILELTKSALASDKTIISKLVSMLGCSKVTTMPKLHY